MIAAQQHGPNGLVSSSLLIPAFLLVLVLPPLKAGREESQGWAVSWAPMGGATVGC